MMGKKALTIFALLLTVTVYAGNPLQRGINSINRQSAEAYIGFLASDELMGREVGTAQGRTAGRYVASILQSLGIAPLGDSYFQPFTVCQAERQMRNKAWQIHPDSIAKLQDGLHRELHLNNILGIIQGKRSDEYVIVGAHYDHLGYDPALHGDQIYNGADDNASGVSAVLQIARAFVLSGEQPERSVIFAFWDGEEKGLLGSRYFVQSFDGMDSVKGYLNFDMIGRNNDEANPKHVVYFYTESHPVFGEWLKAAVKNFGLDLKPDYRPWDNPVGGSDNGSFAQAGVPIVWYHTDGHPDYHKPSDHADKINWPKLVDITKAAFYDMWMFANEKEF